MRSRSEHREEGDVAIGLLEAPTPRVVGKYDAIRGPPPDPILDHRRRLLYQGRCPGCAERLDSGVALREQPCPRCGTETKLPVAEPLSDALRARFHRRLWGILGFVAISQLLFGWFPLLGSAAVVGAAALHRMLLLDPASAHLGSRRRLVTRWTVRLGVGATVAFSLVLHELLVLVPGVAGWVKALLAAATVEGLGLATLKYVTWQIERERAGVPVAKTEWVVVFGSLGLLGAATASFALAVWWVVDRLGGLFGGLS